MSINNYVDGLYIKDGRLINDRPSSESGIARAASIKRSVKNIIFTILGEKPFSPNFGSFISESLFELTTNYDTIALEDEIQNILYRFEPRIDNISVTVSIVPDSNELNATVQYDIVGIPSPSQIVDILLFPARV